MTSVVCVGDLHLSDKPPSQCTLQYNDQLFEMLAEIVAISADHAAVVFAGDIFHCKAPHRTSHRTVQRMIEVIQAFRCPVYIVPGNHDYQNDRFDSIHETQPIGVLFRAGARLLDGWDEQFPLYGIPWQQDWSNPGDVFTDWLCEGGARWDDLGRCLLVTHAPIYPPGRENPYECLPAWEVATAIQSGYCYYGHVHDYHGTFTVGLSLGEGQRDIASGVVFCNQGAVSRGSLQEEDLTRKPAVAVWHSDRDGEAAFERVELVSAPPASEVFRLVEAAATADHRDRLEDFLAAVGRSQVSQTSVEAVLSHLWTLELSDAQRSLAEEVLVAAAAGELRG